MSDKFFLKLLISVCGEAAYASIASDYPVARDNQGEGVSGEGVSDCAKGSIVSGTAG